MTGLEATAIDSTTPTDPATPTGNGTLAQALADYQTALAERHAAYDSGELIAPAEADPRMVAAIERAIAATI